MTVTLFIVHTLTLSQAEDDGTLELDIDSISQGLLWKIHGLIMKHAPEVEDAIRKTIQGRESPKTTAKPPPKNGVLFKMPPKQSFLNGKLV